MMNGNARLLKFFAVIATTVAVSAAVYQPDQRKLLAL